MPKSAKKAKSKKSQKSLIQIHQKKIWWSVLIFCITILLVFALVFHARGEQYRELSDLQTQVQELINLQRDNSISIVPNGQMLAQVNKAQDNIREFNLFGADKELNTLKKYVYSSHSLVEEAIDKKNAEEAAQVQLAAQRAAAEAANVQAKNPPVTGMIQIPILMYHKPPADFDTQMAILKSKGYNTVHMADVANAFAGKASLPPKPAVITFDDGFADQEATMAVLQKYNFKATLYLIVGGQISHYCIGLLRVDGETCGDAYLKPNNVRQMLGSGLIEIGAHTLDHPNLAAMNENDQWVQIKGSRDYLQSTFGVDVTSFAYPYGQYNTISLQQVAKAGFSTAVTTQPGILQNPSQPFLLHRTRVTSELP